MLPSQQQMGSNKKTYLSHPLIFSSAAEERLYQTCIAKTALEQNTLVILPTALGKTVISALVTAEVLLSYRDSRVLVMAPTRPLVMQHKRSFQSLIRFPEDQFALLTGKTSAEYRESVWTAATPRLVFATPQVVRNDIREGRLSTLKDFGLLVFDECHRSVKEYAYTEVAESYAKSSPYPLILGMTASPGSDLTKVMGVCKSLYVEHIEQRGDEDPDVKPFINPVTVEWKEADLPLAYEPVRAILRGMLNSRISTLRTRGYLKKSTFVSRMDLLDLGSELRYRAEMSMEEERGPLYYAISLQSQALTMFHMIELLDTQGAYTLKRFMERLEEDSESKKSHSVITSEGAYASLNELLAGHCNVEHPKVEELKKIASQQLKSNPQSRMLVFTQYRDTATHLVEELNKIEGVRAERFVGQASKIRDKGLTQDEQASLIDDLRKGYINTLCATSIAEEGLDIPEVDLVIFYEPIPSEIRYIQRRGRTGRKAAGRGLILVTRDTNDIVYLHASERRTVKMLKIIETLNKKLEPVLRSRERPPRNPMSSEELEKLIAKPEPLIQSPQEMYDDVKRFDRLASRAERAVYMKILEYGMDGFDDDKLYSEMEEEEGYPRNIVKAALHRLVKRSYLSGGTGKGKGEEKATLPVKEILGSRLMEIEVEQVLQGEAVVVVDQKWHARLNVSDYNGPRQLIKKHATFRAQCELYHSSGVLCVKVKQVVHKLG